MDIFDVARHYLCCPKCKSTLSTTKLSDSDGTLGCTCGCSYMILDYIPIMISKEYINTNLLIEFSQRHKEHAINISPCIDKLDAVKSHQLSTWDDQYINDTKTNEKSLFRTLPRRKVHPRNPFYSRSYKLLNDQIDDLIKLKSNNVFLELGCGTGSLTRFGYENFSFYIGLDISYSGIRRCFNSSTSSNCLFIVGDAENLPIRSSVVSMAASQWVFEHLSRPDLAVKELKRVVTPNGKVYHDTNHDNFFLTYRWFQMKLNQEKYDARMHEAGHDRDRFFSRRKIKSLFSENNFKTRVSLCYGLADMIIYRAICGYSNLLKIIIKQLNGINTHHNEERSDAYTQHSKIEFNYNTTTSHDIIERKPIIAIYNFFMFLVRCLFQWPDDILFFLGFGESVIVQGTLMSGDKNKLSKQSS